MKNKKQLCSLKKKRKDKYEYVNSLGETYIFSWEELEEYLAGKPAQIGNGFKFKI